MSIGKHSSSKSNMDKTIITFRIVSLVIIIICLYFIWIWYKENKHNNIILNNLLSNVDFDNKVITSDNKEAIDFSNLININTDTVGWLIVNNTDINYSVVQAKDNSYYLTHSFDNSYNSAGWIFADYRNKLDGSDKNIIIYGHNRRDGSMFSSLKNILNEDWYLNKENHIITFYTPSETLRFQVFSIYKIESSNYDTTTHFYSDDEYKIFLDKIKNYSIYNFNLEVDSNDQILTLSTCANNTDYRVVLHAKKIS